VNPPATSGAVVCVGGAVLDRTLRLLGEPVGGTSNPAGGATSFGGVARNVAENLARLGVPARLVSRVGDDAPGALLVARLRAAGVGTDGVTAEPGASTAQYVAILDPDGDLVIGAADMAVLDRIALPDIPAGDGWLFADCNLAAPVLAGLLARGGRLAVDGVSTPKVVRLPADLTGLALLFVNRDEALAWLTVHRPEQAAWADGELATVLLEAGVEQVVLTRGPRPAVLADATGVRELPAVPATVLDVTGAGDALVAGTLAELVAGRGLDDAVRFGHAAAAATVAVVGGVRTDLSRALVDELVAGTVEGVTG
jgi:pseudouridine kinase